MKKTVKHNFFTSKASISYILYKMVGITSFGSLSQPWERREPPSTTTGCWRRKKRSSTFSQSERELLRRIIFFVLSLLLFYSFGKKISEEKYCEPHFLYQKPIRTKNNEKKIIFSNYWVCLLLYRI